MRPNHKCPVQGCLRAISLDAHMCSRHWRCLTEREQRRFAEYVMGMWGVIQNDEITLEEVLIGDEAYWSAKILRRVALDDIIRRPGQVAMEG